MKKKFLASVLSLSILCQSGMVVQADSSLDKKYKEAYDSTNKVVSLAEKYNVKPFFKEGSSDFIDVIQSVEYGMQKEIINARSKVNTLPKSIQTMKNTLSSILDNYQHPIYEKTVEGISKLDKMKNNLSNFTGKENAYDVYINFTEIQDLIIQISQLINDMPVEHKSSYSSALDKYQQLLLNGTNELVNLTKKTKDGAFKNHNYLILNAIKNKLSNNKNILDFTNKLIEENDKIITNHAISNEILAKLALENGFKEDIYFENENIYKSLIHPNRISLVIFKDGSFNLICNPSKLNDTKDLLQILMPNHVDTIINAATKNNAYKLISSNNLDLSIETTEDGNSTSLKFIKFYE